MNRLGTEVGIPASSNILEVPRGAVWRRVDLHLHSPGVESFALPSGASPDTEERRRRIAAAYVEQLKQAGIQVGAITDYNGVRVEWFRLLHDLARAENIVLFPGVELSFADFRYGLHVLAVFAEDEDLSRINDFVKALQKDPTVPLFSADRSHRDIISSEQPVECLRKLRERFHCLIIPPHPDQRNGFLKSMALQEAARFLNDLRPDAVEHIRKEDMDRLRRNGGLPLQWLNGLAQVEFSDPKRIEEVGGKQLADGTPRATYLKLSVLDLDALRLALHDPETRLAVGSVPETTHARILTMEVQGSGFLGNQSVRWSDDLNTLIGGRGTGKSAIVEVLRYALDIKPYADAAYRQDLVKHALGSGGKVTLLVERPTGQGGGRRYRVSRVWGEDPRVQEADSGSPVPVRPTEVFGPSSEPVILGQREIQAVSADEAYRLRLLDDLIGEEAVHVARDVARAREAAEANGRAILEAQKKLEKRAEYDERLKTIQHEIDFYEKEGVAAKLRTHTDLSSDGKVLQRASERLKEWRQTWSELDAAMLRPVQGAIAALRAGRSVRKEVLQRAADVLEALRAKLGGLVQEGGAAFAEAESALREAQAQWREGLAPLENELLRLRRELHRDALDPDRLLKLTEERAALIPVVKDLDAVATHLSQLRDARRALLQHLRDRRYAEHVLRREKCEQVVESLKGRLRLTVGFKAQKDDYRRALASLFRGSGVSADALERLVAPEATDGTALAEAVQSGADELRKRFDLTPAMAQRVVDWLAGDETRLMQLETLIPPDNVRIELIVDGSPRSLDRLSVGQRATAVLLLLFALRGRPLVLDQPEDDLDNRFVYEDVVSLLREEKGVENPERRRQIIAATHNANIPVLGDAELVLALEARESRASVVGRASIDDRTIREQVRTLLEGGEEAFRRRAEKYGGVT